MPGLVGLISKKADLPVQGIDHMIDALRYGHATTVECYQENDVAIGCIHLKTGGQKYIYQTDQAVVVFYGYLTEPNFPPGAGLSSEGSTAAHFIHDLYLAQGEKMMSLLAGAFGFALWDIKRRLLLLASDHLGLRPIYYAEHNGVFRFASETKGILADPSFPHHLNLESVADFFNFAYILGEKTFFQEIQLLPPASILRYQDGHYVIYSYWNIPIPDYYPHRSDKWYDDSIYEVIRSSVKKMVRPELMYGLSLSGGLDSRWIAAFLAEFQPDSLSFTVGTPDSDDTIIAQQVANHMNLTHYSWNPSPGFLAEHAEVYTYLVDGMDGMNNLGEFPITLRVGDYADVSVGGFLGGENFRV